MDKSDLRHMPQQTRTAKFTHVTAQRGNQKDPRRLRQAVSTMSLHADAYQKAPAPSHYHEDKIPWRPELACPAGQTDTDAGSELVKLIPRWHFPMLNDLDRNWAFSEALREEVSSRLSKLLVIDIGAGSGLLAMLAARYGADVVSCEAVSVIARAAEEIVAANGFQRSIQIVPMPSVYLKIGRDIPRRADLIVTEIFDCGLLGEGIIPTVKHARQNLLRPGGRMIPSAGRVFAALLESEQIHKLNYVGATCGLDVSLFNRFSTPHYFPVRLNTWRHQMLSGAQEIFNFDFLNDPLLPEQRRADFVAVRSGRFHGMVFWFELDLNERISISNEPQKTTHWMQAVQCLPDPLDVAEGDVVHMTAAHDDTAIRFMLCG
jgi:hypothetical protein